MTMDYKGSKLEFMGHNHQKNYDKKDIINIELQLKITETFPKSPHMAKLDHKICRVLVAIKLLGRLGHKS
jgi:hypothetical protein